MLRNPDYKGVNIVEEEGKRVLRLLSGDPNIYEGGWDTPQFMKDAVMRAINDGYNMYPHRLPGIMERLIASIVSWEKKINNTKFSEKDIIPTQGIAGAIRLVFECLLNPKDEVVLTDPTYTPYIRAVKDKGGKTVFFRKIEGQDWIPDLDELRKKITPKTKGLVLIHPHNPTGALYDEKTLKALVDIVGEYGFPLISDEIYGQFIYDGAKFISLTSVAGDVPCLVLNSLSKAYVATGWRIGHVSIHDPSGKIDCLRENMDTRKTIAGAIPTPLIFGAMAAYEGPVDHIYEMNEKLNKRRGHSYKRLNEIDGISTTKPKAAFFVFPKIEGIGKIWTDDYDFVNDLKREKQIAVGPGSNYGETCSMGHVRIPFLPSERVLGDVFDRIESFMKKRLSQRT